MITLFGIILAIIIIALVFMILAAVALPVFGILLIVGIIIAIIGALFDFVFSWPVIIILIALAVVYYNKNRK